MEAAQLKNIARSSSFIMTGKVVEKLLQFVNGIIIIRLITKDDFGLISLSFAIVQLLMTIASAGFGNALPRLLAKHLNGNTKDELKTNEIVSICFLITLFSSVAFAGALYGFADQVAALFSKPDLAPVLRPFATMLPPLTLIFFFTAIFRSYQTTLPKIAFEGVALRLTRLFLLIAAIILGLHFHGVIFAYTGAVWLSFIMYAIYITRSGVLILNFKIHKKLILPIIAFSFPLLLLALVNRFLNWVGVFILGFYHTSGEVGLYNGGLRLAELVSMPMLAVVFIYLPIASRMASDGQSNELQQFYSTITKWISLIALPIMLVITLDSHYLLNLLFGANYLPAASILQIQAIGLVAHAFFGPNGMTLIACGSPRQVLTSSIVGLGTAIILCIFLTPRYGGLGTAVGIGLGSIAGNCCRSYSLYAVHNIHLTWKAIKSVMISLLAGSFMLIPLLVVNSNSIIFHSFWALATACMCFVPLLFYSDFSKDDRMLYELIKKKLFGRIA